MVDLTVSELAHAIAPTISGRHADPELLLIRRVRHWTLAGVLTPLGGAHSGTGRHRLYSPETVYSAAVINSLVELGLPIGVLKFVADALAGIPRTSIDPWFDLWRSAIGGNRSVFLTLGLSIPPPGSGKSFTGGMMIDDEAEFLCGAGRMQEGVWVNLTRLFQKIVPLG